MINRGFVVTSLLIALALLSSGCASFHVYRVQTNADGTQLVDKSVEGIPYYMPRPYLEVYEPFVVDTKPYFVKARVTSDGKYLRLESAPGSLIAKNESGEFIFSVPGAGAAGQEKGVEEVSANGQSLEGASPTPKTASSAIEGRAADSTDTGSKTSTKSDSTKGNDTSKAGTASTKVSSTSDFYITPGRHFFDIVYLPDYSEERIIQTHGGFGQAKLSVTLAQGWSLAALNAQVDNSELAKRFFETYDAGLQLAQKLAAASLFPPAGALQGAQPRSAPVEAGEEVTCKLTVTTIVAPGLYPLPKDVEYPARPANREHVPTLAEHLGLKTYEVYVVGALVPTGDSPLSFAPSSSSPGQSSAGKGATPPIISKEDIIKIVMQAISKLVLTDVIQGYSGKVVSVSGSEGSKPGHFSVVVILDTLPASAADTETLRKQLMAVAQSALNVKSITVEDLEVKAK